MNSSGVCAANSRVNGRRTTTSTPASSRRVSFSSGSLRNLSSTPGASTRRGCGSKVSTTARSEEHTSELQSPCNLVCRLLLEKKKKTETNPTPHRKNKHTNNTYRKRKISSPSSLSR